MRIKFLITSAFLLFSILAIAQNNEDSLIMRQSKIMSKRMEDSLGLSAPEYSKLVSINYEILKRKTTLMRSSGNRIETGRQVQIIENTRDSLYSAVLPAVKFERYIKLKPFLLVTQ
jgi:hypothetical protein